MASQQANKFQVSRTPRYRAAMRTQRANVKYQPGPSVNSQTPDRPQTGSTGPQRQSRPARDYLPTNLGTQAGNSVAVLEAEFLGCIFLIFLTVFTDSQADYNSKILAVMKRGTLATVLFFILALFSASGPNAAKVSKAFGALVLAGIFLGTAGQGTISALDTFFKADWSSGDTTQGSSSSAAGAGQQTTPAQPSQSIIDRINGAIAKLNDLLQIPGIGFIK